jgi:hypothetical protein
MGQGNILIIIGMIIVGVHFMNGGTMDNLFDFDIKFSPDKETENKKTTTTKKTVTKETTDTPPTEPEPDPVELVVCDYSNYGAPDYSGTNKEGDLCTDSIQSERELACLTNPPKGYSGSINVFGLESQPKLGCCNDDGMCRWQN